MFPFTSSRPVHLSLSLSLSLYFSLASCPVLSTRMIPTARQLPATCVCTRARLFPSSTSYARILTLRVLTLTLHYLLYYCYRGRFIEPHYLQFLSHPGERERAHIILFAFGNGRGNYVRPVETYKRRVTSFLLISVGRTGLCEIIMHL